LMQASNHRRWKSWLRRGSTPRRFGTGPSVWGVISLITALHGPARRRLLPRHRAAQHPPCPRRPDLRRAQGPTQPADTRPAHAAGRRTSRAQGRATWRADAASSRRHDEDVVFAHANGRAIDKKTDYDDWTALLQKAGVRHVRCTTADTPPPRSRSRRTCIRASSWSWTATADAHHEGHLQPCHAGPGPRGGRPDGHPAAEESPAEKGGAEGTRTPDPHTAS
jgi:hypothetical protein